MKKAQQQSNKEKTVNGNKFEKDLYFKIKKNDKLKLHSIKRQTKYYGEKSIYDIVFEEFKKQIPNGNYKTKSAERILHKIICEKMKEYKDKPLRNRQRYHKRSDIDFITDNKYLINGKLRNIKIIIDTTTSARGDRIKAKAQDAEVYKSFKFPHLYLIVLPNDEYFDSHGYANPRNEIKNCKTVIYDNNFCNLYKNEDVSLIIQENDLFDFITYINRRKEQDINLLVENWKKKRFNDMYKKRKVEVKELENEIFNSVMDRLN